MINPTPQDSSKRIKELLVNLWNDAIKAGAGSDWNKSRIDRAVVTLCDFLATEKVQAALLAQIDELEYLQIIDFEPDDPEMEAKYPTLSLDEYLENRIADLQASLKEGNKHGLPPIKTEAEDE